MRRSSSSFAAFLVLSMSIGAAACGSPSSSTSGGAAAGSAEAPKGPAAEAALFASQRSILADLPVMKLIPKDVKAVLAVRDPATIVAKLGTLASFAEAKEPLAKEIDAAAKDLSKDLPEIAALAQNGVDLGKPAGVVWTDADLDTMAIFAAVSDEAAMRKWMDDRAKQANGKREVVTVGDAAVLRAKRDVTRAVVLRKGHVFWVRSRDAWGLDPERVTAAAEAIAKTAEADSLGADATFTKAMEALAYGAQAAAFVNAGRLAESLVAARTKALEAATKKADEAKTALDEAEKKKRKSAIDEAKYALQEAERGKWRAEQQAKSVEVLGQMKDEVPAIAAGIDLGDREVRLKAFVALPKPGAVKVFAPLQAVSPVFDAAIGARAAGSFAIDPRVIDFVTEHVGARSFQWDVLPFGRARSVLSRLGVAAKDLDPLLDGEVSAAAHMQKVEAPAPSASAATDAPSASASPSASATGAAPSTGAPTATGAPSSTAAPSASAAGTQTLEREGFTAIWRVSDPAKVSALLDAAWKATEPSEAAKRGDYKRTAPDTFEVSNGPREPATRIRLAGNLLVVTTLPAVAEGAADAKPRATWMASADHPILKQLAGIESATGILAFDGSTWRRRNMFGASGLFAVRGPSGLDMRDFGMIGVLGSPGTAKGKKLQEQRGKLRDQLRVLESALDQQKEMVWKGFAERLGSTVFFAKPADGGVAIYGGLFTKEASLAALAEAALAGWLSVGPRWEKWGEKADLEKKIRDLDDLIDADRQKAMDDLIGGVLGGLGADPGVSVLGGPGRRAGFDDDLNTLLDQPGGFGSHGPSKAGSGSGSITPGAEPKKKP